VLSSPPLAWSTSVGLRFGVWKGRRVDDEPMVTVGVDTHTDVHVAAVLDQTGRLLGTRDFSATMRCLKRYIARETYPLLTSHNVRTAKT
jgi:hypothetical protein